jgi:hypothetical protein
MDFSRDDIGLCYLILKKSGQEDLVTKSIHFLLAFKCWFHKEFTVLKPHNLAGQCSALLYLAGGGKKVNLVKVNKTLIKTQMQTKA